MKCKCGSPMRREIRPERFVCIICGKSEWSFPMKDMSKLLKGGKRGGNG